MCLILDKTLPTGVVANYWKLKLNGVGDPSGQVHGIMMLYLSESARAANDAPVAQFSYLLNLSNSVLDAALAENPPRGSLKVAYDLFMAMPEFAGAVAG